GVSSEFDPLDVTQFTVEEMKAAVQAAENWGTYVAVHAYTPKAIQNAIEAGVKVIEHAQLTDEETMKIMAEKGIWWSSQAFLSSNYQRKEPIDTTKMSPEQKRSYFTLENRNKGTIKAYEWAKKYKVKTAWGTDLFGSPRLADQEGQRLT